MKKIIILFALSITSLLSGQNEFSNLISKYENQKDATVIKINPEMFDLLGNISSDENSTEINEIKKLSSQLNNIQIISFSNPNKKIYSEFLNKVDQKKYKELMSVKSNDGNLKILMNGSEDIINELILISDNSFILMSGNMKMKDVKGVVKNIQK